METCCSEIERNSQKEILVTIGTKRGIMTEYVVTNKLKNIARFDLAEATPEAAQKYVKKHKIKHAYIHFIEKNDEPERKDHSLLIGAFMGGFFR